MDLLDRRFVFVLGKGGVGKTTVALCLALAAARRKKRVLLAMTNAKERVSELLGTEAIGTEISTLPTGFDAVNMTPETALAEYGMMILKIRAVYKAVFENRLVNAFLHGTPGLSAWAMLGKAFFHADRAHNRDAYDLVIMDAPATGHALDMLRVPMVLHKVAPPGLLRREADRALALFRQPEHAGAVLVSLPEEMPVNETIDLHHALVNEIGITPLHLVINRALDALFLPQDRKLVEGLGERLAEDSPLNSLARAGRRRALREDVQEQSTLRLKQAISIGTSTLPYRSGIEREVTIIEELSTHFDEIVA